MQPCIHGTRLTADPSSHTDARLAPTITCVWLTCGVDASSADLAATHVCYQRFREEVMSPL